MIQCSSSQVLYVQVAVYLDWVAFNHSVLVHGAWRGHAHDLMLLLPRTVAMP